MCGIVGHLGPQNSVELVLEGLKRLEYRGYDSAGVCFVDERDELKVYKKSGKLENLKGLLGDQKYVARSCIGHTRWATHGEVNDSNSHPHQAESLALVHNGIIENADELREKLMTEGHVFQSETDSEVFLHLISNAMKKGETFVDAVASSFKKIDGNSAFVILNAEENHILAIKKGAPLVCGINEVSSEVLVSSDPYALVGIVEKLYFPEDSVLCSLTSANKDLLNFYELDGTKTKRYLSKKQEMSLEVTDKGDFEHFMLKEIHEQPELIRSLTQYYFQGEGSEVLERVAKLKPERFLMSACGTAYYAGLMVRDLVEANNRVPVSCELASEFRYRNPIVGKNDVGLFISQSGETADTLAAQNYCKEKGIPTLSLVNVEGSTLFRDCDENLLIRAGIEVGVASTKAFTQMVLTGSLMSFALSGSLAQDSSRVELAAKYSLLAERVEKLLATSEKIQEIALQIYQNDGFFFTGRGNYFPVALEGALKLKEIAYVHAEGYASGELKHGPIALIDDKMVNIALVGEELFDKTISNIQEIKARRGQIVVIGQQGNAQLRNLADYFIELDLTGLGQLAPIYANVANQLLAYYMAKAKGTDIDKPRNLAKSVTVE